MLENDPAVTAEHELGEAQPTASNGVLPVEERLLPGPQTADAPRGGAVPYALASRLRERAARGAELGVWVDASLALLREPLEDLVVKDVLC